MERNYSSKIEQFTGNGESGEFQILGGSIELQGRVHGTGAVAAVAKLYATNDRQNDNSWVEVAALTLSGADSDLDTAKGSTALVWGKIVVSGLTGTLDVSLGMSKGGGSSSGGTTGTQDVNIVGASGGVTINVDEADLAVLGAEADAAATTDTGNFSIIALIKRGLQNWTTALANLASLVSGLTQNPAVVTGNITAATAAPTTVAGLTASSYISIPGGIVDSVVARVSSIAGGAATATFAFYASDDGVNLYPISGLPVGGSAGSGSLTSSSTVVGAWSLKGASARAVYLIATTIGAGATVAGKLSATMNQSRVTSILRGSSGGSVSAASGTSTTEAVAVQGAQVVTTVANIANGTAITAAIDLGTARLARVAMPAAWTAANITFQASYDGATFSDLYDASGSEYTVIAAASRAIILPLSDFIGIRYIKIRSGTSAAAVNQGASRDLNLVLVP